MKTVSSDLNSRDLDEAEAQSIGAGVALKRIYKRHKINHAISFHRSIRAADRFREQQDALNRFRTIGPKTTNLHISSKKTAAERSELLREFIGHKRALMTNARCLTEGVDVPAIDCVMFADPKQSRIDIVQAAGRALRQYRGKECGYIVVPLIVPEKMDFKKFAETTAFRQVAQTITALSTQDERIADEFRAIEEGRKSSGKIVEIEGDIPVGMKMKLGDFAEAISTRVWENVGRANWRKFEEARAFARRLGLKSSSEWQDYYTSGKKPHDIPTNPHVIYTSDGWAGMGDWLGTGKIAHRYREYRTFTKARVFVRGLNLKSSDEWIAYCQSGKKPDDIPTHPHIIYATSGWAGMGDWLGTGAVGPGLRQWRPFKKARTLVRSLKLKSGAEWKDYSKSGKKPDDIPAKPNVVYATTGWVGMGDWLGTGRIADQAHEYRTFNKARTFVRGLGLKSKAEWSAYCKSNKKPADIPAGPSKTYANDGWAGWGDWLGTGTVAYRFRQWRSFKKARAFVRNLNLKSGTNGSPIVSQARSPTTSRLFLTDVYAPSGWAGMGDWLGTGAVGPGSRQWRSFKEALAFVRGLNLKSSGEWFAYCQSGKKPDDIPTNPNLTYAEAGWAGMGDWLGTGRRRGKGWRSFNKARAFVRGLNLKSFTEWRDYCKFGKKPANIPANPNRTYAEAGWAGYGDWFGIERRR